ncbi:MAG: ATP-dependent DNA ligase LigA [Halobellus sp.]|uniref:ATP-dependent DNA ligase LigA n=1 Tax=Halobellus sp. TaxID=1979212 RepID=UPI0035D44308
MQFAAFAERAAEMESEPGDLATMDLVATLLEDADAELPTVVRFLQGRVYPAWDSTTLHIGPALLHEAIARAAGQNVTADDVESQLADVGEIGAVAATYDFGGQRGLGAFAGGGHDALTVAEVDERLREVATITGDGSERRRLDTLFGLFNRSSAAEAKFLARLVLGEMRIGVGEGTVRDAVARAFLDDEPLDEGAPSETGGEAEGDDTAAHDGDEWDGVTAPADATVAAVERALQVSNDYGMVAEVAREEGNQGLEAIGLEVGRPVQAMLAQTGTATEAIDAWGEAAVETKFDGARVQVHYDGESTALFSRNMDDVTGPLPEVVEFIDRKLDCPAVLDGEVVAVDESGSPLPFQEVLRRFRRKYDVEQMRDEVRVELRAFDCLHAGGEDLLDARLMERHSRLEELLGDSNAVSKIVVSDDPEEVATVENAALEAGHEGIMLKDPASTYDPGKRGQNWLKRKPDVETLDLVVTGAEWGEGRRANLLGTFLVSARVGNSTASDADTYATLGKVATGITDERLESLTERLRPHIEHEDGQTVSVEPAVVFEVGYEEIQRSPTYSSGYALRFPRFVEVRDDKQPADADTLERVERLQ